MTYETSLLSHDDRSEWEALYRGYAEFYEMPMRNDILDTIWGWIHDDAHPFYGLVAKTNSGEAVGFMHCRPMPSPLRGCFVGFLDDLFVKPEARGSGVVEALYEALEALGRQQGWPFVRWLTAEDNLRGRAVYDRLANKTAWVTYQLTIE